MPRWSKSLNGPPRKGGKPMPNTAPISPSTGEAMIPSWRHRAASFTNLPCCRHRTSSGHQGQVVAHSEAHSVSAPLAIRGRSSPPLVSGAPWRPQVIIIIIIIIITALQYSTRGGHVGRSKSTSTHRPLLSMTRFFFSDAPDITPAHPSRGLLHSHPLA